MFIKHTKRQGISQLPRT